MARLHVLWILAWALVRTLFGRLTNRREGLAVFRENYDPDRLYPATVEERSLLAATSRCIACGLCDLGASRNGAGPMDLALASSRMDSDADAALVGLAGLPDEVLLAKERMCPTNVPLVRLAALLRRRAVGAPELG